jgi:hypothetical protein
MNLNERKKADSRSPHLLKLSQANADKFADYLQQSPGATLGRRIDRRKGKESGI